MKKITAKIAIVSLLSLSAQTLFLISPTELDSANLTSVSDTLSTSRLSYYGELASQHTAGSTIVQVATSGQPSTSTSNLFTGDTVWIGDGITGTEYTVDDLIDTDEFQVTAGLESGDDDAGDLVIATRSATHTVGFTTVSAITDGAIRVLIPSGTNGNNDGIPNHDGFDYGVDAPSLTGPSSGGVTSWETPTASASGATGCSAGNHCFEARYNGTNSLAQALTFVIGGANQLINPTSATSDSYTVTIQHLGSQSTGYTLIDSTNIQIALIESVRVTATVDPTITFTVAGVNSETSACGNTTDITTTATTIPFGVMSLNTFKDGAQTLTVSTNADGGYAVTSIENDQLGKDGATTPAIVDTPGDNASATHSSSDEWSTSTTNGFGYSMENDDATTITFEYSTATGDCTGTFCARQFAVNQEAEAAQTLFSSTSVANAENIYICPRLSIGATQEAGDYENNLTYTATATF